MKRAFLIAFVLVVGVQTAFGFTELLNYLKGRVEADAIALDWQSNSETGVKSYVIERSEINSENYKELGTLSATGSNSTYHFRDANFSITQQQGASNNGGNHTMSELYKYRLKINYSNAISYSQTITVTRPSAGVKRTWGMIKEMFR